MPSERLGFDWGGGDRPVVPHRRPIAVDLFAGAGGFALGMEQAGLDVVAAVEYDPIHAAVHKFNFPLTDVLCADVSRLDVTDLRPAIERGVAAHGAADQWDGQIDVIFGGPPCQGFSSGGKRRPGDERNLLIFDFLRLVKEIQPRYFVMENVPPLRNYVEERDIKILDRFVLEIEASGYEVIKPVQVLNASRYGVPQDRRRLIVIGRRKREAPYAYPLPTVRPLPKRAGDTPKPWEVGGREQDETLPIGPTVGEAINDLPDLDEFEELWESDQVQLSRAQVARMEKAASWYARQLRDESLDESNLARPRWWYPEMLTASTRTEHTSETIARFAATKRGESEPKSRFYRLDARGLCSTLRAGTGYERGSFMAPRPIHPKLPRVISVREAARLHSFPDWFRFHVTKWHSFRQIGNALPPRLGRALGRELVAALGVSPAVPAQPIELGDSNLLTLSTRDAAAYFGAALDDVPSHRRRWRDRAGVPDPRRAAA